MAESPGALLGKASRAGADEAFSDLVHQFQDPLAFLRELVQNALDAGSTLIELRFTHGGEGLVQVEVEDNGEGMDEATIDRYLLTLFRSTKEEDLTKIGKFGIGFVSIFAFEPELAVCETGRAGESWRLIFHPGGRFEKLRLAEPLEGTRVRLLKRMRPEDFERLREQGRRVVAYWCKYAECEIRVDGEPINEPFQLDAPFARRYTEPGTEFWLGLARPGPRSGDAGDPLDGFEARVSFSNRGLTLLEAGRVPGPHEDLAGICLVAKSRYLEHTLTRDNVLQDEQFDKLVDLVRKELDASVLPRLFEHMRRWAAHRSGAVRAPAPGEPALEPCLRMARLPCVRFASQAEREPVFPTTDGEPLSLRRLRRQTVLAARRSNPVTRLLAERGQDVLLRLPGLSDLLRQCAGIEIRSADATYCTAVPSAGSLKPEEAQALCQRVAGLASRAGLRVDGVHLGRLDYPSSKVAKRLFIRQREAFGLTETGVDDRPTIFGGARQLVLNAQHGLARRCLELARDDLELAALLVAQAVVLTESDAGSAAADLPARSFAQRSCEERGP
ncbi:MAG: ATP-binding protein [Deltaproteobacteria bacterium]|nr:ATP-binding protein [Deltaproteobacteria bacterium]